MLRLWKKGVLCLLAALCLLSFPVQAQEHPVYSFTSIDGETVTSSTNAGKVTLIVFVHMSSAYEQTGTLIRNLATADWIGNPGLSVIVADYLGGTADSIRQYITPYAGENTDIVFCADRGDNFFLLSSAAGLLGNVYSLPMSFVVGRDGSVQAYMMGETSEIAFRNLLRTYVEGIDPAPTATPTGSETATEKPTVANQPPTAAATEVPTAKPTAAPTQPVTELTAAPTAIPSHPTQIATEPTQIAAMPTEPSLAEPTSAPETQSTAPATQLPTEPANPPGEDADTKLLVGIVVAVVATLAAGAFLLLWKRKK